MGVNTWKTTVIAELYASIWKQAKKTIQKDVG